MAKICVAGIGPGAPELVTPAALKAIKECDVLIGGKRNLDTFRSLGKESYEFNSGREEMLSFIHRTSSSKRICVVVSGDPGFYSLLDFLVKRLGREQLEVIPGISSFQYLFAKMAKPWKDFGLLSLHGRNLDFLDCLKEKEGLFLLTDRENTPAVIARLLLDHGFERALITVGENLSYEDERIVSGLPGDIMTNSFSNLCVVVIEKDGMDLPYPWYSRRNVSAGKGADYEK